MAEKSANWFPAKRFGWGWGVPVVWQGWAVLGVFFAALLACAFALLPRHMVAFQFSAMGLALALVLVCSIKGEPPSWRSGDRK